MTPASPAQLVPALGLPGLLTTIVVVVIVLLVVRFLLEFALKIAIIAAVLIGLLWFFGALRLLPFTLVP